MNILFLDTETNGLPKDYQAPITDLANWPEIVSLAFVMTDEKGDFITESYPILRRDDLLQEHWDVATMQIHGISPYHSL